MRQPAKPEVAIKTATKNPPPAIIGSYPMLGPGWKARRATKCVVHMTAAMAKPARKPSRNGLALASPEPGRTGNT
jgi:hypothetical protein